MAKFVGIVSRKNLDSIENYELSNMINEARNIKDKNFAQNNYENACFSSCFNNEHCSSEFTIEGIKYYIILNGKISNIEEIKKYINFKYRIREDITTPELICILYHLTGNSFLKKINGAYAIIIWCENTNELLMARDRFGVKPLYYTIISDTIYFASEAKKLLKHKKISAKIDVDGIKQLFGIGPNICSDGAIFKEINVLPPACVATFNSYGFNLYKYWCISAKRHLDSEEETIENVYQMTKNIIENNADIYENSCCFLSGGLDSSIITAIISQSCKKPVNTFSVEYSGNDEFFTPNEFQPNSDVEFIELMSERFNTKHEIITVTPDDLIDNLDNAVIAREHPGLADVDSSLFCFCKKISDKFDYAMSGECADEIFGGYPWFHKKEYLNLNTFPWSKDTEIRERIINKNLISKESLLSYINDKYINSVLETPYLYDDSEDLKRKRELSYLNIKWFMHSLGERSEKIGSNCGLDIVMPFCDYKLIEYVYNIPWEIKNLNNREKGLLRHCFKNDLPTEIINRKKSPYPKTHNPVFEKKLKEKLMDVLSSSDCKIKEFIDIEYLKLLIENESDYGKPWFGQLMAVPQLYAYLLQIEFWIKYFKIKILI